MGESISDAIIALNNKATTFHNRKANLERINSTEIKDLISALRNILIQLEALDPQIESINFCILNDSFIYHYFDLIKIDDGISVYWKFTQNNTVISLREVALNMIVNRFSITQFEDALSKAISTIGNKFGNSDEL